MNRCSGKTREFHNLRNLFSCVFFTAIPTRSQSGSVAKSKSALFFFAHSMPSSIACLTSGLGYGQVGKVCDVASSAYLPHSGNSRFDSESGSVM